MFTPDFVLPDRGECVLVANHSLASDEAVRLSLDFVLARIAFGRRHLPAEIRTCRVVYDIRGQLISETVIAAMTAAVGTAAQVEFKRE